ncbi:MAG TPA: class B sortase [Candidatus Merdenecus merdavium]|nr:class B sortase [Candidatus Merdenecus merdavium]
MKSRKEKTVKREKTIGDHIRNIIMVAAIVVFCYSGYQLITIFLEYKAGTDEYKGLTEFITAAAQEEHQDSEEQEVQEVTETDDYEVDFAGLQEVNPDVIGWIRMEAIDIINYPIVQGKDNDQYLHTTFQGAKNGAGAIFMEYTNKSDLTDQNTFIYGHNMKNESMFGSLKKFHDKATYNISPYIWIYTPTATYQYEIFSYHVAEVNTDSFVNQFEDDETFKQYLDMLQRLSEYDTGVAVDQEDKIITLSTCTNDTSTRFLVHAKLIHVNEKK